MRYETLTTEQAIDLLIIDGEIRWTEDGYRAPQNGVDWLMVSIFFNTQEIHSFNQGMTTKVFCGMPERKYVL